MTFKVTQLIFDDDEEVTEVVARLDARTGQVLGETLGADLKVETDPTADERPLAGTSAPGVTTAMARSTALAHIPTADAIKLFHAVGKVRGTDTVHEVTHDVYESLANVMVMLAEDW